MTHSPRIPIIELMKFWKNYDRVRPTILLVIISIVLILFGLVIKGLFTLSLIGGLIILLYGFVSALWFWKKGCAIPD